MGLLQNFEGKTEGIEVTVPARWRRCARMLGIHWEARSDVGAHGSYWSDVPRLMIFLDDMSCVRISEGHDTAARSGQSLSTALFVPAGQSLSSYFSKAHEFRHLDLHFEAAWLRQLLTPSLGEHVVDDMFSRTISTEGSPQVEALAHLLMSEISDPAHDEFYFESLSCAMVIAALSPALSKAKPSAGRLTAHQMRKLRQGFDQRGGQRVSISEMAQLVGLSESWFSHVFKSTTGLTPVRWQKNRRVSNAQRLLRDTDLSVADVAARLGFSDQSHFTKVFRDVSGHTPASWRRLLNDRESV
ncbi:helix-turn-helix domain-containing protein [Tritonibacter scottomollicae]|uniref:helix-turn-helix domain-containing protein n=1 Tax=Tritonibacter scottomollicae TaxID=483013 RepID=UPI003BABCA24